MFDHDNRVLRSRASRVGREVTDALVRMSVDRPRRPRGGDDVVLARLEAGDAELAGEWR